MSLSLKSEIALKGTSVGTPDRRV